MQPERRLWIFWIKEPFLLFRDLFELIKMRPPFPQKECSLAWIGVENISFVWPQSPWPPQEIPPPKYWMIEQPSELQTSWTGLLRRPLLLQGHAPRMNTSFRCESIIICLESGSRLRKSKRFCKYFSRSSSTTTPNPGNKVLNQRYFESLKPSFTSTTISFADLRY